MCTSLFLSVSIVCIYTKAIFKNTISSLCAKYKNLRPKRCFCVFGLSIRLLFWGQGITAIPTVYIWRLGHKPTECWLSCSGSHWMTIWAILQSPHLTSPLPGPLCPWPSVSLYSFLLMHTHATSVCPMCWPLFLPACKSQPSWVAGQHPALDCTIGCGPRYQILSHVFASCASQKKHWHARIARETLRERHAKRAWFSHVRVFFDQRNKSYTY